MQQKVKTRLSARCVFSSNWNEAGQGMVLVIGPGLLDALRVRVGGTFDFAVRRGFVPPSWSLVGIVAAADVVELGSG